MFSKGLMDTQETVHIKTQEASIVAQSMKISDKGKTISFAGQVQVNLAANAIHNEGNRVRPHDESFSTSPPAR